VIVDGAIPIKYANLGVTSVDLEPVRPLASAVVTPTPHVESAR